MSFDSHPVAIVGLAALFPGAADVESYWENIVDGVDAIGPVPRERIDPVYFEPLEPGSNPRRPHRFYCRRGGFVDQHATFDAAEHGVMPVAVDDAEPDQLLSLRLATEALSDAGGADALVRDPERVGVIIGRGSYLTSGLARQDQRVRGAEQVIAVLRDTLPSVSEHELELVRKAFGEQLGPERPEAIIGTVPNLAASRIANRLDLQGPAYTIDAACASSLIAVDHAVTELRSGRCDVMLAGGVHHCHDVTFWSVFTQLGALSHDEQIRPFDERADGLLIGEGTGIVVLKRLADAERDGDRVYAVIRGTGMASDGRESSLMKPKVAGQVLSVERAWRDAGLDPHAVGLIEAHGTATPAGDAAELRTLGTVFGAARGGDRAGLGSVKSMIGHAMPAAGVAGLIKTALALHHRVLPPTLHCERPHPGLSETAFRLVTEAEPWESATTRLAGVNAFGFGGINAHVVLEEAPSSGRATAFAVRPSGERGSATEAERGERVLLLAGSSIDDVARQLGEDDREDGRLLARDDHHRVPDDGDVRLSIVDATPKRLALARKVVRQGKRWHGRNDVWFSPQPLLAPNDGPRVAFLCPGVEPVFDPIVDDLADEFDRPRPAMDEIEQLGFQGRAVIEVGRLLHAVLVECGVRPDLVAGHSIGEWTGMITTEMIPPDAVDPFVASIDPSDLDVPGVQYAALGCGAADAEAALAGLDGVVVSHDNCPHQSIICGEDDAVREALARLKRKQILGQTLSFRSGFHSPMFEPHLGPIRGHLDRLPLQPPSTPLWSATTVDRYPDDPDGIRALNLRHFVEPVRFRQLLGRLHAEGVRAFVQLGVGSLTGFADDTLRDLDALTIAASSSKRTGVDQLRRVLAALWAEGAPDLAFGRLGAAPEPTSREHRGSRLRLGAPLVHVAGQVQLSVADPAASSLPDLSSGDPLLTEFTAILDEASRASHDVLDALPAAGFAAPRRQATSAAVVPPAASSRTMTLSVDEWPWVMDHSFFDQPDGWDDPSDFFPVVPLTTTLELLQAEAIRLVPGKVVVGLRDVRALRWIAAAPANEVTISAKVVGDDEVRVSIDGFARGIVRLADAHATLRPEPDRSPLANERVPDITPRQIYDDRWAFHGPEFQGIVELTALADDGLRAVIEAPRVLGSLLDNAGQAVGFWISYHTEVDRVALPMAVRSFDFYGPAPPPGERVECTVRFRKVEDEYARADVELTWNGGVWCAITGWDDKRFESDEVVFPMLQRPGREVLTEAQPGGWVLVRERWRTSASRELLMRRYTRAVERAEYEQRTPRDQRQWFLGRIAVKDAVRSRLLDGTRDIYPIEVLVANDSDGRPYLASGPAGSEDFTVSLAHRDGVAVAIVGDATNVGIDIELVEERSRRFESMTLCDRELPFVEGATGHDRDLVLTRLWAVKEAAAKAAGTGLQGRPKELEVVEIDGSRHRVGDLWIDTTTQQTEEGTYVVAWTCHEPTNR